MTTKLEHSAAGLTMLAIMALGAWQAIGALQTGFTKEISGTQADFRSGKSTDQFSRLLDRNLPSRDTLIGLANLGRYWLLQGGGEEVRVGSNGWLFSSEEFQYFPDGIDNTARRIRIIEHVQQRLAALNVQLVVALVPDKTRVHAEHLWLGSYPDWHRERYAHLLKAIGATNTPVVDLLSPLEQAVTSGETVYYRTDTHWNQVGAQIAARYIADAVRALPVSLPESEFTTRMASEPSSRAGDLARMIGQTALPDAITLGKDIEHQATTEKTSSDSGTSLFGDSTPPVTLAGSSYSLRANFHGFLQESLGAEVLNTAQDGGGFFQAISAYLDDEAFQNTPPSVILWEIPERMFPKPLSDQERSFK